MSVRDVVRGMVRWLAARARRWAERVLVADASTADTAGSGPSPPPSAGSPPAHWLERVRGVTEWTGLPPHPPDPSRPSVPPRVVGSLRPARAAAPVRPGPDIGGDEPGPRADAPPAPAERPRPRPAPLAVAGVFEASAGRLRVPPGSPVPDRPAIRPLPAPVLPEAPDEAAVSRPLTAPPARVALSARPAAESEPSPPTAHGRSPGTEAARPGEASPEGRTPATTRHATGEMDLAPPSASLRDPASAPAPDREFPRPPATPERAARTPADGVPAWPRPRERREPPPPFSPRTDSEPRARDVRPETGGSAQGPIPPPHAGRICDGRLPLRRRPSGSAHDGPRRRPRDGASRMPNAGRSCPRIRPCSWSSRRKPSKPGSACARSTTGRGASRWSAWSS